MPQPNPVAFSIFGTDIMWYAICLCTGMIVASIIVYYRAPKHGLTGDNMLSLILVSIPVGIIGARAYYVIFNWSWYAGDFYKIINIREGGLAIHGGLILGISVGLILCWILNFRPLNVLDLCVPAIALAQSIGRWGNYFNSEAHGGPTDLPWAVYIDGQTYHPTFLYESIWCLFLFFLLSYVDNHRQFEGQVFLLYTFLYSLERVFIESLRTDSLMIGPYKQAQVLSTCVIIASVIFYVILKWKNKEKAVKAAEDKIECKSDEGDKK